MGLLHSVAKTAVVVGTATATRGAVNRRQANKNVAAYSEAQDAAAVQHAQRVQAAAPQPAPPAPAAPAQEDVIAQLERLGALKAQGILTEEEFQAQKAKLLGN
jgi:hypothetical protein